MWHLLTRLIGWVKIPQIVKRFQRGSGAYLKPTWAERVAAAADDQQQSLLKEEIEAQCPPDPDVGLAGYDPLPKKTEKVANDTMWDEAVYPSDVSNQHVSPPSAATEVPVANWRRVPPWMKGN